MSDHLTGYYVPTCSAERRLWQEVVLRAVRDSIRQCRSKRPKDKAAEDLARVQARDWIERAGRDFQAVCHLAGMDPDFIRDAVLGGRVNPTRLRQLVRE